MHRSDLVKSDVTAAQCAAGDEFWHCTRWLDATVDFERVQVVERQSSRVVVAFLTGSQANEVVKVYASSLWRDADVTTARDWRTRDLRIHALDQERPLDDATTAAIDMCAALAHDSDHNDVDAVRGVLRRLDRPDDLTELHELAYTPSSADPVKFAGFVIAPNTAWRDLYAAFAASEPQLIDERAEETSSHWTWIHEDTRAAAVAVMRRWAELPPSGSEARHPDEVARLRAIVESAASTLDDAGRHDQALRIRQAAFPHRYAAATTDPHTETPAAFPAG